eukprot:TRINITY_DN7006_c0_g1_i1.p1 TRINITY_DN7006_c0_g1~~TRINITY_DN7006_c0_g1_i1.p1  ORF type:complete len:764 (-),score=117.56 TRINITY_DN7006_c0_g1_i1:554-2845(-)
MPRRICCLSLQGKCSFGEQCKHGAHSPDDGKTVCSFGGKCTQGHASRAKSQPPKPKGKVAFASHSDHIPAGKGGDGVPKAVPKPKGSLPTDLSALLSALASAAEKLGAEASSVKATSAEVAAKSGSRTVVERMESLREVIDSVDAHRKHIHAAKMTLEKARKESAKQPDGGVLTRLEEAIGKLSVKLDHLDTEADRLHTRTTHAADETAVLIDAFHHKAPKPSPAMVRGMLAAMRADHSTTLDVAFVVDCTGSMAGWMSAAKDRIAELVDSLSRSMSLHVRVAFVGYKDYGDEDRCQTLDFTTPDEFSRFVRGITADGGADGEEDCWIGLHTAATQLSWDAQTSRSIVWIADAPNHGYGGSGDRFPGGDPDGRTVESVCKDLHDADVALTFIECNGTTRKMMDAVILELAAYDREVQEFPLGNATDRLVTSTTASIAKSHSRTVSHGAPGKGGATMMTGKRSIKPFAVVEHLPTWQLSAGCWHRYNARLHSMKLPELPPSDKVRAMCALKPEMGTEGIVVAVDEVPFARGEMRFAFFCALCHDRVKGAKGFGTSSGTRMYPKDAAVPTKARWVVKESRYTDRTLNSFASHVDEMTASFFAWEVARMYGAAMAAALKLSSASALPKELFVGVTPVKVLELEGDPRPEECGVKKNRILNIEMAWVGTFLKFNNNNGWRDDKHDAPQAFTHYSYAVSDGRFMVCDLQGWVTDRGYLFTDPAVHTMYRSKLLPLPTNLGMDGMARFFATHRCGKACRTLGLKPITSR